MTTQPDDRLPPHVRARAIRSGHELGWRRDDVLEAMTAARDTGLACLGGQVQFVFEDGTCELYWLNFDSSERGDLSWDEYVRRSHDECATALGRLLAGTDFEQEGRRSFRFLEEKAAAGRDLSDHLVFVCYFVTPP
jgi:hypothetical protein